MSDYRQDSQLERTFKAVRKDLLRQGGAQISTTRNYNFAIIPYRPEEEFACRAQVSRLSAELRDAGWTTATIALHSLLLQWVRGLDDDYLEALIAREKRLWSRDPTRALNHLREKIVQEIGGPDGLAADVVREIRKLLDEVDAGNGTRESRAPGAVGLLCRVVSQLGQAQAHKRGAASGGASGAPSAHRRRADAPQATRRLRHSGPGRALPSARSRAHGGRLRYDG